MTSYPPRSVIRVYGDSLGLPRHEEGVAWHATYAELFCGAMRHRHPQVTFSLYNRSRAAATTPQLWRDYQTDCGYFGPEGSALLVIQGGVVDCAPRPIPNAAKRLLSLQPALVRKPIVRFLHDHRARLVRTRPWRDTPPATFRSTLAAWLARAAREFVRVLVINIAPTTPNIEEHSPGFGASVEMYNGLIAAAVEAAEENVILIDVHRAIRAAAEPIETYVNPSDGHHITPRGHALYARMLEEAAA